MRIFSRHNLEEAWKEIYLSKPIRKRELSKGIDKVSIQDFEKDAPHHLDTIYRQLKGGFFVFDNYLPFTKPRPGKAPRVIQSPTIKDRIVQKILNKYLIRNHLKDKFDQAGVVGSVEGNSLKSIVKRIQNFKNEGFKYILKTDLIDYFPSIDRKRLLRLFGYHIRDKELAKYVRAYLDASQEKGIPQGPPLSPAMANLYLLSFDQHLSKLKRIRHIRYVDDILIFCKTENEARRRYLYIKNYLEGVHLNIHPLEDNTKTKIDLLDNSEIDTLGIIHQSNKLLIKKKKLLEFMNSVVKPIQFPSNLDLCAGKNREEKLKNLIKDLNHKINGWAGMYSFCDVKEEFKRIDDRIHTNIEKLIDSAFDKKASYSNIKTKALNSVDRLSKYKT